MTTERSTRRPNSINLQDNRIFGPGNSKANGAAEAAVKTAKRILRKCMAGGEDLMNWRNTPDGDTGRSPVQKMFGRQARTSLPTKENKLRPTHPKSEERYMMQEKRGKIAESFLDRKQLEPLDIGDVVRMQPMTPGVEWQQARVNKKDQQQVVRGQNRGRN